MLAGSLDAVIAGQESTISFDSDRIVLRIASARRAWRIRRSIPRGAKRIVKILSETDLRVMIQIGAANEFELFPHPSWLTKLLTPQLR